MFGAEGAGLEPGSLQKGDQRQVVSGRTAWRHRDGERGRGAWRLSGEDLQGVKRVRMQGAVHRAVHRADKGLDCGGGRARVLEGGRWVREARGVQR